MPDINSLRRLLRGRPRILVTADFSSEGLAELSRLGPVRTIGWAANEWFVDAPHLGAAVRDADVLVAGYEPVDAQLLSQAHSLRMIASIRSAPGANVDLDVATQLGIPVFHTVGRTDIAVAEFTLLVMLALTRNLIPAVDWMRHRPKGFDAGPEFYRGTVWGDRASSPQLAFSGLELEGRTLGLIGLGAIGSRVLDKAKALGMTVLVSDPFVDATTIARLGGRAMSQHDVLSGSDIVSLHARLDARTRGMINAEAFRAMRPGAFFINTGRAGLVDRASLLDALNDGHVAGAALDVFDEEPPPVDDLLVRHPRVVPTPHLAAWTAELTSNHSRSVLDALNAIISGDDLIQLANPEVMKPTGYLR